MTNSSPQRWPTWKLSSHVVSLSYRHLLELKRRFTDTQSQLSPHRILGASPILQCHICAVAGHLLDISVDRRCWKQSRGRRYLWNDSWFTCWPLPGKAAAHSCWNFPLLSPDLWLCHGLGKGTPDHWDVPWSAVGSAGHVSWLATRVKSAVLSCRALLRQVNTRKTSLSIIRVATKLYVIVLSIPSASGYPVSSRMSSSVSISGLMEHQIAFIDLLCANQRVSHWHHEHRLCTVGHMFFSFAAFQLLDICPSLEKVFATLVSVWKMFH